MERKIGEINEELSNLEITGKNLKPFDLEAAKAGKPVCTRNGRKARIICFDRNAARYNIVALVDCSGFPNKEDAVKVYTNDGRSFTDGEAPDDLMMVSEKHEGWVNVFKTPGGRTTIGCLHPTREEAVSQVDERDVTYVTTTKIEWEE